MKMCISHRSSFKIWTKLFAVKCRYITKNKRALYIQMVPFTCLYRLCVEPARSYLPAVLWTGLCCAVATAHPFPRTATCETNITLCVSALPCEPGPRPPTEPTLLKWKTQPPTSDAITNTAKTLDRNYPATVRGIHT